MGSDDLFKKRREARKQRQYEYKTPKANSFLIVTEGERREPLLVNSFDGVNTAIKNAKRRMVSFRNGVDKPSEYDPGTMVHKLMQELKVYLDEK